MYLNEIDNKNVNKQATSHPLFLADNTNGPVSHFNTMPISVCYTEMRMFVYFAVSRCIFFLFGQTVLDAVMSVKSYILCVCTTVLLSSFANVLSCC